jgi:hypothetical protein
MTARTAGTLADPIGRNPYGGIAIGADERDVSSHAELRRFVVANASI